MCLETELKEIKKSIKELHDSTEHAIISARDSVPSSISDVLMGLADTMNKVIVEQKRQSEILKPIEQRFLRTNGFLDTFFFIAKFAGGASAILFAVDFLREHYFRH